MKTIRKCNFTTKQCFIICLIVILLSNLAIMAAFKYDDILSYTAWSVDFWDCLFHGKLSTYYEYSETSLRGAVHGCPDGSYLTFFPWIIWNLPLFLFNINSSKNVTGSFCLLWSKCLLLLCLAFTAFYAFKIVKKLTDDNVELALLSSILITGSIEIMSSTAYAGQDEIIYICAFLAATYHFMTGQRRAAIILSVISFTICPLMIIPLAYLWVIYEKNIIKLISWGIISLAPSLIFDLLYRGSDMYQSVKGVNTLLTFQLMVNTTVFDSAISNFSIPCVILILGVIFAYLWVDKDSDKIMLLLSIVFFIFCFFMRHTFYRSFLYVPFFAILACSYKDLSLPRSLALYITGFLRVIYYMICTPAYCFSKNSLYTNYGQFFSEDPAICSYIVLNPLLQDTAIIFLRALIMGASFFILLSFAVKK